ncbi:MAG: type secretion protein [Proteobacteria bacterium]|nr:type secretion protein [Pseudomonadota bacterium]
MIRRGCIIHGKNVGLHGDKTSTGAQCIAARPGMSVMGLLKLYIGDKTTPCPKCGEVGVIVSGDHRHSNSAAVAVDGSEIRCRCPQGTNFLIAPGTIPQLSAAKAMIAPVVAPEPEQHAQAAKKEKPEKEITLTIGVFFDGTGNNAVNTQNMMKAYTAGHYNLDDPEAESILAKCARENFGVSGSGATSYTGYYTNIHWLSTLYKKTLSGNDSDVQTGIYIDGIGTEAGKPDSKLGQGFGISDTGVIAKTNRAVSQLVKAISDAVEDIRSKSGCEIVIKLCSLTYLASAGAQPQRVILPTASSPQTRPLSAPSGRA